MGIPDQFTCLLRNLYAVQEATVKTRHGTMDWFQIGKGVSQGCILSPCLFNLDAEFSLVAESCPTLCDPTNCSTPGLPVHHQLPESTQTHVHWVHRPWWTHPRFSSVQFSCSVMCDSLWLHELQHARPPCPTPTPGVHSDSRPSSQWCHPAISSSVVPFSSSVPLHFLP